MSQRVVLFSCLVIGVVSTNALAQTQQLERVEITGSALRKVDAETALPITVLKAEDLVQAGVTTVEQALERISANQATLGSAQEVGVFTGGKAEASLRGLGGKRTLVLLNGRRLANHAYDAGAADLNAIPLSAVQRIEVLRDGASALYGTDAIGGVINIILKQDHQGLEVAARAQLPAHANGDSHGASVVAGVGSLAREGFNFFGALDYRKQDALLATDRGFSATGVRPDRNRSRVSGITFPGAINGFNPSLPNCSAPSSIPNSAGTACVYDFIRDIDIVPKAEQYSLTLKGSGQVGASVVSLEYLRAEKLSEHRLAATPVIMRMAATNPFFPVGAPTTDIDPVTAGTQAGGVVNWRTVPAGKRVRENETVHERTVLNMQGTLSDDWDYRAGLWNSQNVSEDRFLDGYINYGLLQAGLGITYDPSGAVIDTPANAVINPFGPQTDAGMAAINASKILGTALKAKGEVNGLDLRLARDVTQLPGGPLTAAMGVEFRKEQFVFDLQDIAPQAFGSGLELAQDTSGSRHVNAGFAELGIPIQPNLEATLQARMDQYSDSGSTFNPKLGMRWQPGPKVLLRGSYNTGFRAPTLYEIYQPQQLSFTVGGYNDPLLCPGGTAVGGASAGVVCGQQVLQRFGGPVGYGQPAGALEPEKARTYNLGILLEPQPGTAIGVDLWWITLRDTVSQLSESTVFQDPSKYTARIVRCSQLTVAERAAIPVCLNYPAFDPIAYIDVPTENLGKTRTNGADLSVSHRFTATPYGRFSVSLDGTYVNTYNFQRERDGAYQVAAGRFADSWPVFRWQHLLQVHWQQGAWAATLAQRYQSSYLDQDGINQVRAYGLWDGSLTWLASKRLSVSGGVKNIFDTEPPWSVQLATAPANYDPRFTDPLGRTFWLHLRYIVR